MPKSSASLANVAIALAAIAVGASAIYGEFIRQPTKSGIDPLAPPVFVESWEQLIPIGRTQGDSGAPVRIVQFSDLECPACARYEATIQRTLQRYPGTVSVTFVHFPLEMHRYARRASKAAECAGDQGRFAEMVGHLYRAQLEFSTNPWTELASESGVADMGDFESCMRDSSESKRIVLGEKAANQLQLPGTPAIIINGFLYPAPPTDSSLADAITRFTNGGLPAGARRKAERKIDVVW